MPIADALSRDPLQLQAHVSNQTCHLAQYIAHVLVHEAGVCVFCWLCSSSILQTFALVCVSCTEHTFYYCNPSSKAGHVISHQIRVLLRRIRLTDSCCWLQGVC